MYTFLCDYIHIYKTSYLYSLNYFIRQRKRSFANSHAPVRSPLNNNNRKYLRGAPPIWSQGKFVHPGAKQQAADTNVASAVPRVFLAFARSFWKLVKAKGNRFVCFTCVCPIDWILICVLVCCVFSLDRQRVGCVGMTSNMARSKTKSAPPVPPSRRPVAGSVSDARAKTILKEAVDAVVNSFAKHTHGYGRGKSHAHALLITPHVCTTWHSLTHWP